MQGRIGNDTVGSALSSAERCPMANKAESAGPDSEEAEGKYMDKGGGQSLGV